MQGRSTPRLIADTFGLYRRYPLLFLVLAAAVIVPYQLLVLAATGGDTLASASAGAGIPLSLLDFAVVGPLVSALHVHAVSDVRVGVEPRLLPIAKRGLAALPIVCATTVMYVLGLVVGALLFVIPAFVLFIRWAVVVQAAALERKGWNTALRSSWELTRSPWVHVIVFVVCVGLVGFVPSFLLGRALDDDPTTVASFLAGTAVQVLIVSFTALATALLYFDLRTRRGMPAVPPPKPAVPEAPRLHPGIDPRVYSDEDRPNGWYVDPSSPGHMRFWNGADPPGWGGRTRTPYKLRRRWENENG